MKSNMGSTDKALRIVAAIAIAVMAYFNIISGTLAIILLAVAVIFLLTSMVNFCPLYYPFKISTKKEAEPNN
jgi:hypothetical protein